MNKTTTLTKRYLFKKKKKTEKPASSKYTLIMCKVLRASDFTLAFDRNTTTTCIHNDSNNNFIAFHFVHTVVI